MLMREIGLGVKIRVGMGAMLGIMDVASDMYVAYNFWIDGDYYAFYILVGLIAASVLAQVVLVVFSNHKRSRKIIAKEVRSTLTHDPNHACPPLTFSSRSLARRWRSSSSR